MPSYDTRFNTLSLEDVDPGDCTKEVLLDVQAAGMEPSEYMSTDDLQHHFGGISRYHIKDYLRQLGAKPIGQLINSNNGQRLRGRGKEVYARTVADEIEALVTATINVEGIKEEAARSLEES